MKQLSLALYKLKRSDFWMTSYILRGKKTNFLAVDSFWILLLILICFAFVFYFYWHVISSTNWFLLLPSGGSAPILKLQLHQLHLTATSLPSLFKHKQFLAIAWDFIEKGMHIKGCFRVVGRIQSARHAGGADSEGSLSERRYSGQASHNQQPTLPFAFSN